MTDELHNLVDILQDTAADLREDAENDLAAGVDHGALTKHGHAKERAEIAGMIKRRAHTEESLEDAIEQLVEDFS
jgi:hypothetical protein